MYKDLIKMINSGSLTVERFFTMDPFSYVNDKVYGQVTSEVDFFEDLFVTTNKSYERLAMMAKLAIDDSLSAVVITGYSGSGKTNFLKFCEAIIQNKIQLKNYNDVEAEIERLYSLNDSSDGTNGDAPTFFDEAKKEKASSEIKIIKDKFYTSIHKIKGILYDTYFNTSPNEIRETIADFINQNLNGITVYLDFDKDKQEHKVPLKLKLIRQIETHLYIDNAQNIEKAYNFYQLNREEFKKAFEGCCDYFYDEAINFIYSQKEFDFEEYKNKFINIMSNLNIDQLLGIEILIKMAENLSEEPLNIYYFIDNIDMISGDNNEVLIESISKFWDFIKEIQSFIHTIRSQTDKYDKNIIWIKTYEKFKYVFSMRETTAMHICDHLRSRISSYAKHIDISSDIDKSFIFKKRYDLIKEYIDKKLITNDAFVEISECIESITEDKFYKWNFFELFNNDYRKSIECLCAMSSKKSSSIYSSLSLINNSDSYKKFGGRGVIVKSICDSFKKWSYFSSLGIPMLKESSKTKPYNITLVRLILTVLENLQKDRDIPEDSFFFIKRENCISLKKLYEHVQLFCENQDVFLECIKRMFSGRNWSYWSHLITFDNILEYSDKDLRKALESDDIEDAIYIRCTKAGERYINTLCVHYEFFACRFAANSSNGLFSQTYTKRRGKYSFEKQINEVKENVNQCCIELSSANLALMENLGFTELDDLLDSLYVKDRQFHEERIIHNHITYLDAFRIYLICGPLKNDVINVNKCLLNYIKEYLDLLKNDGQFYSTNSEVLFDELSICIDAIEKKEYNDRTTIISRDYYRDTFATITNDSKEILLTV